MNTLAGKEDDIDLLRRQLRRNLSMLLSVGWAQLTERVRPETRGSLHQTVRQTLLKLRASAPIEQCRRLVVSILVYCFVEVALLPPQLQRCWEWEDNASNPSLPSDDAIRTVWRDWCELAVNVLTSVSAPLHPIVSHHLLDSVIKSQLKEIVKLLRNKLQRRLALGTGEFDGFWATGPSNVAVNDESLTAAAAAAAAVAPNRKSKRREHDDPDDVRGRRKRLKLSSGVSFVNSAASVSASFVAAAPAAATAAAADVSASGSVVQQPRRQIRFDPVQQEQQNNQQQQLVDNNSDDESSVRPSTASTSTPVHRHVQPSPSLLLTLNVQPEVLLLSSPRRPSNVFHRSGARFCQHQQQQRPLMPPPPPPTASSRQNVGFLRRTAGLLSKLRLGSRGAYAMTSAAADPATAGAGPARRLGSADPCRLFSHTRLPGLATSPSEI